MRERHFPRQCHSCEAPMARQEDTCWRCGAEWADGHTAAPQPSVSAPARFLEPGEQTRETADVKARQAVGRVRQTVNV